MGLSYVERLQVAIDRLGPDVARKLLNESGLAEFEKLSNRTLNRWQAARKDEEFDKRAKLAVRLLETATPSPTKQPLRYALMPNPASIPLLFMRSLVPELEAPPSSKHDVPIKDRPLPESESLRIGLGLTVQHVKVDGLEVPETLLDALVQEHIDLTVIPEKTFEVYKGGIPIRAIQLCRVAEAPTIVFRKGHGYPERNQVAYVFVAMRRQNSLDQAQRLVERLRSRSGGLNIMEPQEIESPEEIARECLIQDNRLVYAFGPAKFLMKAYDEVRSKARFQMNVYFDTNPEHLGITNWYLYLREDAFEVGQVALLFRALEQVTRRSRMSSIFSRLQSGSHDRELLDITGLRRDMFGVVCKTTEEFRCDNLSPRLVEHLINAYFRISS
jgi:hypothetical protein